MADHATTGTLLATALAAAVPLWQHELKRHPWLQIEARLPEAARMIASQGDVLQFGGGKKGQAAEVFNALAEAIAALSFAPGGFTFLGQHYEDQHPDLERQGPSR